MKNHVILLMSILVSSYAQTANAADTSNQLATSVYDVVLRNEKLNLDGKIDESVWEDVPMISGEFHYPWEHVEAPMTQFKAFHDNNNFYFSFFVKDKDVILDKNWKDDESTVDVEDRVELFFAGCNVDKPGVNGMEKYYGVEIDAGGRVHDYSILYYRNFDGKWNLTTLTTKAGLNKDGYVVEGKISLKELSDLNLIKNNIMRTGVYRAEFSTPKIGEKDPIMQWISWIDPKTQSPDFHVDSSFGEFRFVK